MTVLFFPDNTVLVNFGIIDRYDVLERLANGNGRWCGTVAMECDESARLWPSMAKASGIFGEPLLPTPTEHISTQILRTRMAAPGELPHKHLGEAETIAIIVERGLGSESYFVTDDKGASLFAQQEGIRVATTWDLIRLASKAGFLSEVDAWEAVRALDAEGRGRPPGSTGRAAFVAWLNPAT